jgi:hypothetical protein
MYGVKCNGFYDWTNIDDDASNSLIERAEQIKEMMRTREKARETINAEQMRQRDELNKRTKRIMRTFLSKDTVVYRKNEGMITKLQPRWLGPYKVMDHDERGNYLLIDSLGEGVAGKYPLEKLKIVENGRIEEQIGEIKVILKDRTINNKIEYLVEWKNGDKSSWIREEDFLQVDIINDYWKAKSSNGEAKKRGRPRKATALMIIANERENEAIMWLMIGGIIGMFMTMLMIHTRIRWKERVEENKSIDVKNTPSIDTIELDNRLLKYLPRRDAEVL